MSERSLDHRKEDRLVQSLPITSAGRTEEQRAMPEQGTRGFTLSSCLPHRSETHPAEDLPHHSKEHSK